MNLTLYKDYTTTGPILGGKRPKGRNNSTFFKERIQLFLKPGKSRPQTQEVFFKKRKKERKKRQRNTTQMKEQTRKTEVQINEKEIDKLEKEFRIMIVKMIRKLENKMEKMQE